MKRNLTAIFCCIIILFTSFSYAFAGTNDPTAAAEGAVLMDALTGELLFAQNPDKKLAPASTTKLMTALLTLENTNLDEMVEVGVNPPYADGSRVGIITGERFTVRDLLAGLMLSSGNDCAIALAEHISGTIEEFAKLMNDRASELGCTNTNFVNPHGLYDKNHYTSARDLAYIMREVIKYDEFLDIEKKFYYEMAPTEIDPNTKWLGNKNQLMIKGARNYYPYAVAGKTGWTSDSGHSYCAAAVKDGVTLISAMINSSLGRDNYFPETVALFEYGYNNFQLIKLCEKGEAVSELKLYDQAIPLLASEDVYKVVKKEAADNIKSSVIYKLEEKELGSSSFDAGTELMNASIYFEDEIIDTIAVIGGASYEVPKEVVVQNKFNQIKPLLIRMLIGVFGLVLLIFIVRTINIKRRHKRRRMSKSYKYKNKYR